MEPGMNKRIGRGVVGRAVIFHGDKYVVTKVYEGRKVYGIVQQLLEIRREHNKRTWIFGNIARSSVKFVRHNYEVKA